MIRLSTDVHGPITSGIDLGVLQNVFFVRIGQKNSLRPDAAVLFKKMRKRYKNILMVKYFWSYPLWVKGFAKRNFSLLTTLGESSRGLGNKEKCPLVSVDACLVNLQQINSVLFYCVISSSESVYSLIPWRHKWCCERECLWCSASQIRERN